MGELKSKEVEKEVKPKKVYKPRKSRETTKDTPLKIKRARCIREIHKILEDLGPWSINISDLSKQFFVRWETVKGWFNGILKSLDAESIDNISRKGEMMIDGHLKRLEDIAETGDDKDRVAATRASFKGLDTLGNWLERFGRKQKVADKLEVSGKLRNKMEVEIIEIQKKEDEQGEDDDSLPTD